MRIRKINRLLFRAKPQTLESEPMFYIEQEKTGDRDLRKWTKDSTRKPEIGPE